MTVVCIDDIDRSGIPGPHPEIGEHCTVIQIGLGKLLTGEVISVYCFKEYPAEFGYDINQFVPLQEVSKILKVSQRIGKP